MFSYPEVLTVCQYHSGFPRYVLTSEGFITRMGPLITTGRVDVRHNCLLHHHPDYAVPAGEDGVSSHLQSPWLAPLRIRMLLVSAVVIPLT